MFQNQVYITPSIGLPGDFASSNPMNYKLSSNGKMVADASGVTVGRFAILNADGTVTSIPGTAAAAPTYRIGFVHREDNAQITQFLAEAGNTIQAGQPVSLFGSGDFLINADAITGTPVRGAVIAWDTSTGLINVGGTIAGNLVDTGWIMVSETATANATIIIALATRRS
jgi:predicted RecA/RadA family phage recombinase